MYEKQSLADIQEILLWQKLNKQLLALKRRNSSIGDKHHKILQRFCFDTRLFSRINSNPLLNNIPLSLITDFEDLFLVTLKLNSWNRLLLSFLPGTFSLNLERALAEAFATLDKYDDKYGLVENERDDEDSDEELFVFVNNYLSSKDSIKLNLPNIIDSIHSDKSNILKKIGKFIDYSKNVIIEDDTLFLDFSALTSNSNNEELLNNIMASYNNGFCKTSTPDIGNGNKLQRYRQIERVKRILVEIIGNNKAKPSIIEYAKYELFVFQEEMKLVEKFSKALQDWTSQNSPTMIKICSVQPFFFINYPMPLV